MDACQASRGRYSQPESPRKRNGKRRTSTRRPSGPTLCRQPLETALDPGSREAAFVFISSRGSASDAMRQRRISSKLASLPEFMNFKLFGKTILVVHIKFGLFLGHPLSQGAVFVCVFPRHEKEAEEMADRFGFSGIPPKADRMGTLRWFCCAP